jgi:hypothetical protein
MPAIRQPAAEDQERGAEVEHDPDPERDVVVIELVPVQDRGDTEKCGEEGDREKASLDGVPTPLPQHPDEEVRAS